MKIEQFLEDSLNNKAFVLKKKHGIIRTIVTFVVLACLGIGCINAYQLQHWYLFAGTCLMTFAYALSFYWGADHYLITLPQYAKSITFYKIGDEYFAGSSLEQAQLFANLTNKQHIEIEAIDCYSFYKPTNTPQ